VNPGDLVLNGSLLVSMPMALLAGIVSFLSPCVLPLIPGYLGFVSGVSSSKTRIVLGTTFFVLGFSLVFVLLGALFGGIGAVVFSSGLAWLQRVLGVFVIAMGLVLIGQFSFLQRTIKFNVSPRLGLVGAPLLGIAFGLGWTPCIGPTLAAVLTLSSSSADPLRGGILAFIYALGIGLPFLAVAAGFGWAARSMEFFKQHIRAVNIAGAVLLIVLGLLMVSGIWNVVIAWLQSEVIGYVQLSI